MSYKVTSEGKRTKRYKDSKSAVSDASDRALKEGRASVDTDDGLGIGDAILWGGIAVLVILVLKSLAG